MSIAFLTGCPAKVAARPCSPDMSSASRGGNGSGFAGCTDDGQPTGTKLFILSLNRYSWMADRLEVLLEFPD